MKNSSPYGSGRLAAPCLVVDFEGFLFFLRILLICIRGGMHLPDFNTTRRHLPTTASTRKGMSTERYGDVSTGALACCTSSGGVIDLSVHKDLHHRRAHLRTDAQFNEISAWRPATCRNILTSHFSRPPGP